MSFKNKASKGRLLAARFHPDKIRQVVHEEKQKSCRPLCRKGNRHLTGIHNGNFYRIPVPPSSSDKSTASSLLPALPKFFTPMSPPKPLTPVSPPLTEATTAATICGESATPSSSSQASNASSGSSSSSSSGTTASSAGRSATVVTAALVKLSSSAKKRSEFWERLWQWLKENGSTLVLNFGSICSLIGFTRSDVLELRGLSVTGSVCGIIYNLTSPPLRWTPILWSSTFAAVNGYKIVHILQERQGSVHFTHDQEERYIHFFMPHGITPKQFEMIHTKATLLHVKKGELIVRQNEALDHVYLVVAGSTRASVLGRFVTAASTTPTAHNERAGGASGAWIGEMGLLERAWIKEQAASSSRSSGNGASSASNGTNGNATTPAIIADLENDEDLATIPANSASRESDSGRNKNGSINLAAAASEDALVTTSSGSTKQATPPAPAPPKQPALKANRAMYTIVAEEDCTVLRWSHADMQELMERSTDMRAALTRAMTAAVVAKVINFTVSRSSAKPTWATWLDDWKYNAGAQVQTLQSSSSSTAVIPNHDVGGTEFKEEEEQLPRYPLKRFR